MASDFGDDGDADGDDDGYYEAPSAPAAKAPKVISRALLSSSSSSNSSKNSKAADVGGFALMMHDNPDLAEFLPQDDDEAPQQNQGVKGSGKFQRSRDRYDRKFGKFRDQRPGDQQQHHGGKKKFAITFNGH